jgi:mannose-6-phosphate isomerase-like protein (cupin superfamily)
MNHNHVKEKNMTDTTHEVKKGKNFTVFESGALKDWVDNSVELPGLGKIPGKLFLKDKLDLTSCEISINAMLPGNGMPIYHTHKENEEIYVFIHGEGQIQIDDETINVREGSIVRIAPNGERIWRNNSKTTLVYIIIQVRENSLRQYGLADSNVPEKQVAW